MTYKITARRTLSMQEEAASTTTACIYNYPLGAQLEYVDEGLLRPTRLEPRGEWKPGLVLSDISLLHLPHFKRLYLYRHGVWLGASFTVLEAE